MSLTSLVQYAVVSVVCAIVVNIVRQLWFPAKNEPPVVFHWVPFVGSTIEYGKDPYKFLFSCREKYGDIFTFILLGGKTTVYLGIKGNEFILNGKVSDLNAQDVYGPLCNPIFGSDVVYDCPNAKFMEQKKMIKFGMTQEALASHVQLIENEVLNYVNKISPKFKGSSGTVDIMDAISEITIFTTGRALQGEEVRQSLTAEFAELMHDLEKGFSPVNFMMPWFPMPHNRKRDNARAKMVVIYEGIINRRRKETDSYKSDMLWHLMRCEYKDGTPLPDKEVAHLMLALLMGGQHSSCNLIVWIMLYLAAYPDITEKLYQEQIENITPQQKTTTGVILPPLEKSHLDLLPLHTNVIKETLRLHNSIHSILRKVTTDMPVPGTSYVVPRNHLLLAAPGVTAQSAEHFPDPQTWDPYRWETKPDTDIVVVENENDMVDYGYGRMSKGTHSPYLPFGAGRHRCIGEKFAYVMTGVVVATMVRTFKFSTLDGQGRGAAAIPKTDYTSMFSAPVQPAVVQWERRG